MAGIYLHIPYCKKRCNYCNFHFTTSLKNKKDLIRGMLLELKNRKSYLKERSVNTIYFGGGTPSILDFNELESIINEAYKYYNISSDIEITLEANPDDLYSKKLSTLKLLGINRLSIGVQSFEDNELQFMNRSHNSKQCFESISAAQEVGFNNISIDLIFGIPNQSKKNWINNLKKAFELDIQHISGYSLTVEPNTVLHKNIENKILNPLDENQATEQFQELMNRCNSEGFEQYEISNYAKRGFMSKHNISYWKQDWYLGIGPSAHSFNGKSRSWNVANNKQYIHGVQLGKQIFEDEHLSTKDKYNEYIFTSLRTIWGINSRHIKKRFGEEISYYFLKSLRKWIHKKYIVIENDAYILTRKGKLQADTISSDLFMI